MTEKSSNIRKDEFVSGAWRGFFTYASRPNKYPTSLSLRFGSGRVVGEGRDGVGSFVIRGTYNARTGECQWVKGYLGKHAVHYAGVLVGGVIQGRWETRPQWMGGFRIWPQGCGEGDDDIETEKAEKPMPAINFTVYVRQE